MRIYITDQKKTMVLELKSWSNEYNNGWSPDFLSDIWDEAPRMYPLDDDADGVCASCAMTMEEYAENKEYWEDEVAAYNRRTSGNVFVEFGDADAEYKKNLKFCLFECEED